MIRHPKITVAIPVYNEEDVIPELIRRVTATLDALPGGPHQVIFVNDGSSDDSLAILKKAVTEDDRLVVVSFSRNFGQQPAYAAACCQPRNRECD